MHDGPSGATRGFQVARAGDPRPSRLARWVRAGAWSVTLAVAVASSSQPALGAAAAGPRDGDGALRQARPAELCELVRVVDGDTLEVQRQGRSLLLRLACVDAEERIGWRPLLSPSAPRTVFGEETALWLEQLLGVRARVSGRTQVGLLLPPGGERRDPFGRLLCHVLLPDGTDLNLLLVRQGRSPYYEKYGSSRVCHAAFVEAQERARRERLGLWNAATNRASTRAAPQVFRPYARLLPWWRARALAVEAWREREAREPALTAAADDSTDLREALAAGAECRVFGSLRELREREKGALTLAFHGPRDGPELRVELPADVATAPLRARLRASLEEFHQNYWWVRGRLGEDEGGFLVMLAEEGQLTPAGPEPEPVAGAAAALDGRQAEESAKGVRRFDQSAPRSRRDG